MSIDDDLDFSGREETDTTSNAPCCCYPVCLDTCYDIISDTDAFQVCCGAASSVISRYFLLSPFILLQVALNYLVVCRKTVSRIKSLGAEDPSLFELTTRCLENSGLKEEGVWFGLIVNPAVLSPC